MVELHDMEADVNSAAGFTSIKTGAPSVVTPQQAVIQGERDRKIPHTGDRARRPFQRTVEYTALCSNVLRRHNVFRPLSRPTTHGVQVMLRYHILGVYY